MLIVDLEDGLGRIGGIRLEAGKLSSGFWVKKHHILEYYAWGGGSWKELHKMHVFFSPLSFILIPVTCI